ncbi:MAG TPA: dephospho-CoA kinase [Acidimicrobiales bacterium]|nr:dephospho-CoA kinase [Acidimicrobiales bacterium]
MLIVGLTGGIGAGKSTVAGLLAERGAEVIDVDALGRQVLEPGGRAQAGVAAEFGPGVLAGDGSIDRAALAKVVFADASALARLTAISHPAINEELVARLRTLPPRTIAVLDMAVLAESELGRVDDRYRYTFVVIVEAPRELREERAVARGSDRDDVRRRMAQQATDEQRRALADVVIANDGTPAQLAEQVDDLWELLRSLAE